jgi:hypothetical protein
MPGRLLKKENRSPRVMLTVSVYLKHMAKTKLHRIVETKLKIGYNIFGF